HLDPERTVRPPPHVVRWRLRNRAAGEDEDVSIVHVAVAEDVHPRKRRGVGQSRSNAADQKRGHHRYERQAKDRTHTHKITVLSTLLLMPRRGPGGSQRSVGSDNLRPAVEARDARYGP